MDFLDGIDDDELLQTLLEEEESTPRDRLASLNLDLDALCPESYRVNTPDEERLLVFATELQRQYSHLYPERTPLLLCPANEYGVKKFVSTCLKPTPPESSQLYTWQGCSSFVANFMSLEPLDPPTEPPQQQFSSTLVLRCQRATSLEFAALLCSLLLGANYDAYVVSGYADREMCERDLRLKECPLLDAEKRSINAKVKTEFNKYMVKQKRELKSRFVTQQEKKKGSSRLLRSKSDEQENRQRNQDPLHGRRVHYWVLVLAGSRSVAEHFFIDPLSGKSYSSDNDHFLGVESVWNNLNYYINMQDCSYGCDEIQFDLEDLEMWEPVLFGATSKKQLIDAVAKRKAGQEVEESIFKQEEGLCPRMFQMPRSWVDDIHITKKDLESRWPGGQNVILYRRVRLEEFAPYLRPDGLVKRLTTYQDVDLMEVHVVKEWFQYRNDMLEQREVDHLDKVTVERFSHGRRFHLQLHRFTDSERVTKFSSARLDYLVRRVERPGEMTEIFEGRCDRLYRRHVTFEQQAEEGDEQGEKKKKDEEEEGNDDDGRTEMKIPQKVVEQFHRDPSKPASEDVAELVFLLGERRIEVTYHVEDFRFIPSRRQFLKPQTSSETQRAEDFKADMVSNFQLDLCEKPLKTLTLYEMLLDLMKEEEESIQQIRTSLREVRDIVACREREDRDVQLVASPWLTEGAIRARNQREEMERLAVEEQLWLEEKEADILTPLLIRRDQSQPLGSVDAHQLHQDCLNEFKLRQAAHANLIQERYAKEVKELHEKHEWYRDHQLHMTKEEKAEYQIFCSEKMMKIQVAKKRLNMHKETAAQKFQALDDRLAKAEVKSIIL